MSAERTGNRRCMERQDLYADDLTNERLPSPAHREEVAHSFKLDPDPLPEPPSQNGELNPERSRTDAG